MHLSPSQTKIIDYLNDGEWHCMANATFFMKDDRKRISELREKGYIIDSKECDGRCGVQHNARLFMRRIVEVPVKPAVQSPKPTLVEAPVKEKKPQLVYDPINNVMKMV